MLNQLEKLAYSYLTQLEAAELVQRFFDAMETIPPADPRTDVSIFNRFMTELQPLAATYNQSLKKVVGNSLTIEVTAADERRDKALRLLRKAVKLALESNVKAEVTAAHHLLMLLDNYSAVPDANYEQETKALDNLSSILASADYQPQITLLGLQRYVNEVGESNRAFATVSGNRLSSEAKKEYLNTRKLRTNLLGKYNDMCLYVLVTASTSGNAYFVQILSHLNTARKYYADIIAQRRGFAAAQKKAAKAASSPAAN